MGQSTFFWVAVAVATLVFAVIDLDALSKRRMGRVHAISVAVYILSLIALTSALWRYANSGGAYVWLYPAGFRIATLTVFGGGRLLASMIRREQALVHRGSDTTDTP